MNFVKAPQGKLPTCVVNEELLRTVESNPHTNIWKLASELRIGHIKFFKTSAFNREGEKNGHVHATQTNAVPDDRSQKHVLLVTVTE